MQCFFLFCVNVYVEWIQLHCIHCFLTGLVLVQNLKLIENMRLYVHKNNWKFGVGKFGCSISFFNFIGMQLLILVWLNNRANWICTCSNDCKRGNAGPRSACDSAHAWHWTSSRGLERGEDGAGWCCFSAS